MRLHLTHRVPRVEREHVVPPTTCPYARCGGQHFRLHQRVNKPVRDTVYEDVTAHRYECLSCHRTFRVYPPGVSRDHSSRRVKGLAVMLYLLGLSYGTVSLALEASGVYLCKSRVCDAVQGVAGRVPGLKREAVFQALRTPTVGGDITSVTRAPRCAQRSAGECRGQWLSLGLTVDATS